MKSLVKKKFSISNLSDWQSFMNSNAKSNSNTGGNFVTKFLNAKSNKTDLILSICMVLLLIPHVRGLTVWHWYTNKGIWAHTEWLISYDGGFVRRGITGEIIKFVHHIFEVHPIHFVIIVSLLIYVSIFCWLVKLCGKKYPIYFLLSTMLLGAPFYSGYVFFKDLLFLLLYMVSVQIIFSINQVHVKFIALNLVCSFGVLTHELFLFICLPYIFLIYCKNEYNKLFSIRSLPFFTISLVFSILVLLNLGSEEIAWEIINSWNKIFQETTPPFCCFELNLAFHAFASSWLDAHLPAQLYWLTKVHNGIFWQPLIWLFLWLCCGIFVTKFVQHYDPGNEKQFIYLYCIHTIILIPIYILAYDYGRWMLHSTFISFVTLYLIDGKFTFETNMKYVRVPIWKSPLVFWQKAVIATCFSVPILWHDFETQLLSTPIWYVVREWIVPAMRMFLI